MDQFIFAKRFASTANAPLAFGTNLLGAIVGGCLEYLSLVFGYRVLLLIAGGLYIAAYLVMSRPTRPAAVVQALGAGPATPVSCR